MDRTFHILVPLARYSKRDLLIRGHTGQFSEGDEWQTNHTWGQNKIFFEMVWNGPITKKNGAFSQKCLSFTQVWEIQKKIPLFIVMSYRMSVEKDWRGFKTIIKCISKFMLTVVHATVNYKITQAQNPKKIVFVFSPPSLTHHVSHLFSKNKKSALLISNSFWFFFLQRDAVYWNSPIAAITKGKIRGYL